MLAEKERAFIVFGIDDRTHAKIGTDLKLHALKKHGEDFRNWLARMIDPSIMIEFIDFDEGGKHFAIISIEPTYDRPVRFTEREYIRIGPNVKNLKDFPEQERVLWQATSRHKFEGAIALSHQDDESVTALLDWVTYYDLSGEGPPGNPREIIRRFLQKGFIREDMEYDAEEAVFRRADRLRP